MGAPKLPLLSASIILAGGMAAAQDFPGVDTRGYADLTYLFSEDDEDEAFLYGDFDVFVRPEALGFGLPLGADLGADAFASGDDRSGRLYAAVTYYLGPDSKFSLGAPRSAYDSFARSVHNDAHGIAGNFVLYSDLAFLTYFESSVPVGVRYDGSAGNFRYAASIHDYDIDGTDFTSIAFGGEYRYGEIIASGAIEQTDVEGFDDRRNLKLGIAGDVGPVLVGTTFRVFEQSDETERAWESYLKYEPTDQIELTGTFQSFSGDATSVLGLSAKYSFSDRLYTRIGAVDSDDEQYHISVGFDF